MGFTWRRDVGSTSLFVAEKKIGKGRGGAQRGEIPSVLGGSEHLRGALSPLFFFGVPKELMCVGLCLEQKTLLIRPSASVAATGCEGQPQRPGKRVRVILL